MPDIELYGHPESGHACKVALALGLAGLAHRVHRVDIWAAPATRPAAFLAANPAAEVPVLILAGAAHVQSGAILLEIAGRFACLGGESAEGMRRARELVIWEANRIGMCLPQLKEAQRPGGEDFAPDVLDWLRMRFAADARRFDLLLGDDPEREMLDVDKRYLVTPHTFLRGLVIHFPDVAAPRSSSSSPGGL